MAAARPVRILFFAAIVAAGCLVSPARAQSATCEGRTPDLVGTEGADELVGTEGDDVIEGLGGDDTIRGLGGNDYICAGAGDDTLDAYGGPKRWPVRKPTGDLLNGGEGDDYLNGGSGTLMVGGAGSDTFVGAATVTFSRSPNGVVADLGSGHAFGEGTDSLVGVRALNGSPFDDRLSGDERRNEIHGGSGNDEVWGAGATDELYGGEGGDLVVGEDGDDHFLYGGAGSDYVSGGEGDDRIEPEIFTLQSHADVGDDFVDGGDGYDTVSFTLGIATSIRVDLSKNAVTGQGDDELWDVERVEGTYGDDWMKGDEYDNSFYGNPGDDVLIGGEGDDRLDPSSFGGHTDDDVVRGGPGADKLYAKDCCGTERMHGGAGRDTISFAGASGGPSQPVSVDLRTQSWVMGTSSDAFTSIEGVQATGADDLIVGDDERNFLFGWWGDDVIRGLGGDDVLVGEVGKDRLDGGPGFDRCRGANDTHERCEDR